MNGTVSRPDDTVRQGCERLDQDMRVRVSRCDRERAVNILFTLNMNPLVSRPGVNRVSRADSWARLTGGMDSRVERAQGRLILQERA